MAESFDFLIVGGGTAGCVLAARLSADPAIRVLLLEAGDDFSGGVAPDTVASARFRAHHDPAVWSDPIAIERGGYGALAAAEPWMFRVPQVIGGGSSVNGMHAQRGLPADYDGWAGCGVRGWSWSDLLPYFRRLECDADFGGDEHGREGPVAIARVKEARWSGLSRAFATALEARGIPRSDDLMTCRTDCIAPVPLNLDGERRASVAEVYLSTSVRRRSNLKIQCRSRVQCLRFDGGRVVGVDAVIDGVVRTFRANETILSAGVIGSPLLLLRSGIGPADQLAECGIRVNADRRGVGRVLRNHVHLSLGLHLRAGARQQRRAVVPCTMVARYSSGLIGAPPTDMMLNIWERNPGALQWDPLSRHFAVLMVLLNACYTTGELRLDPANPVSGMRVRFDALADPRDFERMMRGVRFVAELLRSEPVSRMVASAFFPRPNRWNSLLHRYDWCATAISIAGSLALSGPAWMQRRIIETQGTGLETVARDEQRLGEMIRHVARPASHGTSTCTMGDPSDPLAVTDSRCRVIGVRGLRVVDCSIFPTSVRAGTHIPAIMAAEHATDLMLTELRTAHARVATC